MNDAQSKQVLVLELKWNMKRLTDSRCSQTDEEFKTKRNELTKLEGRKIVHKRDRYRERERGVNGGN